jgi:hypothetical protein
MSNFMKIRPVEADLFHAYRRTDIRNLIVAFRVFAIAPKTHSEQRLPYLLLVALMQDVVSIKERQMVIQ